MSFGGITYYSTYPETYSIVNIITVVRYLLFYYYCRQNIFTYPLLYESLWVGRKIGYVTCLLLRGKKTDVKRWLTHSISHSQSVGVPISPYNITPTNNQTSKTRTVLSNSMRQNEEAPSCWFSCPSSINHPPS